MVHYPPAMAVFSVKVKTYAGNFYSYEVEAPTSYMAEKTAKDICLVDCPTLDPGELVAEATLMSFK